MAEEDFVAFVDRVRAGDQQAAADLVQRYQGLIRREIRLRLSDPAVYRIQDDEDICQSVLASFFVRATLGQYELNDPAQLRQLLLAMARNKLARAGRSAHAQKRDGGRTAAEAADDMSLPGAAPTASRVVAGRELLDAVRGRLSDEERQVVEMRSHGHDWATIANQLGGTPDSRRMQVARALDRVGAELGLEGSDE
jgi:RNA polymerase sigma factor (sigma-70 family)